MKTIINILLTWIIAILVQVLLFNQLQSYGLVQPQVYILCLLMLPVLKHREWEMLIGFGLGFLMDIFSNSLGIHTASCVLVMYLRQPLLGSMVQNIERLNTEVSMRTINEVAYIKYALLAMAIHQVTISLLSVFSFAHLGWAILQIICSFILCGIMVLGYNFLRR